MTSVLDHIPTENFDYREEAVLPVEEPVMGVPIEDQFMSVTRDSGIAPGNEAEQNSIMEVPPSIITQTNMMRYVIYIASLLSLSLTEGMGMASGNHKYSIRLL